jgi:hypothetical protein
MVLTINTFIGVRLQSKLYFHSIKHMFIHYNYLINSYGKSFGYSTDTRE